MKKFGPVTIAYMRMLRRDGMSLTQIAKLYGVHHSTVHYHVGQWMQPATWPMRLVRAGAGL